MGCGRSGGGGREKLQSHRETLGGHVHYLDCGDDFAGVFMSKIIKSVHFQHVQFLESQLYLSKAVSEKIPEGKNEKQEVIVNKKLANVLANLNKWLFTGIIIIIIR